ncbi:MAG: Gar1/Naf1 family protein [Methanobacterium sp.]|nr:Gar1/Naf1 family protein [Methanobacterium sp.]
MKKLGIISHFSNKGRIIVRSDQTPGFGLPVFTDDKKRIGTVIDVFGPTKKPYISVKVYAKNSKNLKNRVGETLFVSSKPTKRWGRKKRKKE